jgi:hypothetical protein
VAAQGQRTADNNRHSVSHTTAVKYIADAWPHLPPHVREAILTLIDAGLVGRERSPAAPRDDESTTVRKEFDSG